MFLGSGVNDATEEAIPFNIEALDRGEQTLCIISYPSVRSRGVFEQLTGRGRCIELVHSQVTFKHAEQIGQNRLCQAGVFKIPLNQLKADSLSKHLKAEVLHYKWSCAL